MQIVALDPRSQAAQSLLAQFDASMVSASQREGERLGSLPGSQAPPSPSPASAPAQELFLGVWLAEWLAGCGAVQVVKDDPSEPYGEIKRMFVHPQFRGRGLSKVLMEQLEAHLRAKGIPLVRLEAGAHQAEALALYERMGYDRREPFGPHATDPGVVFMEKRLTS
jgi:putative acetyltransferase